MASGYALPTANGGSSYSHHGHSNSYSGNSPYLSPSKAASNGISSSNGYPSVKKAGSQNSLYTHAERSNENSPLSSPGEEMYKTPFEHNTFAFQNNHNGGLQAPKTHSHTHIKSPSWSPMKSSSRPRGESDLGRPADPRSPVYRPTLPRLDSAGTLPAPESWFSLPEALTALLIPLPYLLASAAYSTITHEELSGGTHELPPYARVQHGAGGVSKVLPKQKFSSDSGLIEACTLTSGTLLLVGILAKMRVGGQVLDRRKETERGERYGDQAPMGLETVKAAQAMVLRAVSLGLPFYSAMQIGGLRTGLVLLACVAAGLTCADVPFRRTVHDWKHMLLLRRATAVVLLISMATDFAGWTFRAPFWHMLSGYLALAISVFVLPPPLPTLATASSRSTSKSNSPTRSSSSWSKDSISRQAAASPLTCSARDVNITLSSGLAMSLLTICISMISSTSPSLHSTALVLSTLSIAAMSAGIFYAQPYSLRSEHRAGLGLGCLITASVAFLYSPHLWPGTICNGGLSALSFVGVLWDTKTEEHDHAHGHNTTSASHNHTHVHHKDSAESSTNSALTKLLISHCEPGSLIHSILAEKDSRRIAYFTLLNFGFMIVQGIYGYLSGSLGLLSDTVHMFFDCLGLIIGLGAAVASKWPGSPDKPHGWGKLNTLSGFGNGVFLMLVSVEFVWEAVEGILEETELRHVWELLGVSVAGLMVNLIGLIAFGHAHAGHDHGGHSHGHDHGGHEHDHGHVHDHGQAKGHAHHHGCSHEHSYKSSAPETHDHGHGHGHAHNDNMHGIFLHVAADAGGSLAVIISTGLTIWKPWYLWDPLATIIIAILIFAAAVPLVVSSGQKLLLVVPEDVEYGVKNVLQEIGEMRGVVGYAAPRFWIDDRDDAAKAEHPHHDAHHGHDHDHAGHVTAIQRKQKIMGVIHIIAAHAADLEDVRQRVDHFVRERGMDLVIHVERESDAAGSCWCGGAGQPTPTMDRMMTPKTSMGALKTG